MDKMYSSLPKRHRNVVTRRKHPVFKLFLIGALAASNMVWGQFNPAAWYRADGSGQLYSDAGSTPVVSGGQVFQWSEVGTNGYNLLQATAGSRPIFSNTATLANFNPTVTFDGANDFMQFTPGAGINVIDRASGTIVAAGHVNTLKRNGFAGFDATMDYPGLHVFSDYKLLFFTGGPGYQGTSTIAVQANKAFTSASSWQNGGGSSAAYAAATVSLNGTRSEYTGSQLNNANLSNNARNFRIGGDNNYGSFSGQLNEIMVFEDRLTATQLDGVESYLAIKYGTTFANGTRDYKQADGTGVIWSVTTNAGYNNNIAGIGREATLHQKQSWSVNSTREVLIGTTGMANTNAANAVSLTNNQFLIWGDNGLSKTPSVVMAGIPGISHRFAAIWKVQNTSSVGTVRVAWVKNLGNLSLMQSTDAVFSATDVITNMTANETTINGVVYNYADVTLTNGEYFTFAAKVAAPGGVFADLRVWLKSDNGFTPSEWQDFSGNLNNYTQTNTSRQPFTATSSFNFNPIVDFGTTGSNSRFMAIPAGKPYTANGSNSTIFVTSLNRTTPSYSDIIGFGGTTTTASLTQANSPVFITYGSRLRLFPNSASTAPTIPAIQVNRLYLNEMSFTVGTGGIKYGQNGQTQTINSNVSASNAQHANGSILGSQPEARNGLIGEVIAYERDLTEPEKQRVRTYTAIKYGITLPHDYIASDGSTVIWSQVTNAGYNNNIAGLASDEGSALVQKQSQSINTGTQLLIATTGLSGSNLLNGIALTNGQSLVWGDNGLSKTLSASFNFATVPTLNLRFAAIWKVQNMGTVGTVRVTWPSGIPSLTLIQSADATIDNTDARTDMTANSITVNGVSYNYADVTLSNGQYFTFAGYVVGPGGVASATWYRADAQGQLFSDAGTTVSTDGTVVNQWNEYKGTGHNFQQYLGQNRPIFSDATTLANFNPTVTFENNARLYYDPGVGNSIIDRANGTLFAAGKVKSLGQTGFWGFNESNDDPGLHIFGAENKLLFYTRTGSAYTGYSSNAFKANSYFTAGGSWQNGTTNLSAATSSLNGVREEYGPADNILNVLSADGNARDMMMGRDGNTGGLNGQLNELVVFEDRLSVDDMDRVETYLAIKYGTTFAEGSRDYKSSSLATMWTATANNGNRYNIAGIARDDQGALYQKQSWSTNPGNQVLISTTGLANTNAANTAVLSNEQYLVWGDNNLAKSPSVPFGNIGGLPYQRFAAVWKAQNTNSVGTVRVAWRKGYANLKLIQNNTDSTFASGNTVTDMTNTQVVNGVEYAYADVNIANGQYFTFAAFLQAPGGVTAGILMWHKANDGTTTTGTKNEWQDVSGNGRNVTQDDDEARQPLLVTDATYSADSKEYFFNYNPFYYFDGGDVLYRANDAYFPASNSPGAVYSVIMNGGGGTRTPFSFSENDNRPSLTRIGTNYHAYVSNLSNFNTTGYNITTLPAHIGAESWRGSAAGVSLGVNGRTFNSNTLSIAINTTSGSFNIGSQGSTPSEAQLGGMPEVFAYSVDHQNSTGNEKLRINSYLAIKYGITLINDSATATPNYLSSSSAVVWNASEAAFNNNIAGVANDFLSALDQKQSRSVNANTNGQVVISVGEIAETNAANINSLSDGQFLLWGDNGNTVAMTEAGTTYTAFNFDGGVSNARRMKRVWKVQNTSVTEPVQLYFPRTSVGTTTLTTGDACAAYAILFASDSAMTTNLVALPLGISEDSVNYIVAHAFPNGVSYFSFGKVTPLDNGNVYLPAIVEATSEYDNNCGAGAWSHYHKTGDVSEKLLGVSGFTTTELNNLDVVITPEGTTYDDGTVTTNVMARISQVIDSNVTPLSTGKVRIYYSMDEMNAALVPGALTSGWFKYDGSAEEVLIDVYADGIFEANKAVALTPDASGIEDGVNYVEFHGINSFSSFVFLSSTEDLGTILPVDLLHFKAEKQGVNTYLSWETAKEKDNIGFAIERSSDARKWSEIGFVESKGQSAYSYLDEKTLIGTNFYRLKLMDVDGKFEYSQVQMVRFDNAHRLQIIPNPTSADFVVSGLRGNNKIAIANVAGKVLMVTKAEGVETQLIKIAHLPSGMYFVTIANDDGSTEVHKVVKD